MIYSRFSLADRHCLLRKNHHCACADPGDVISFIKIERDRHRKTYFFCHRQCRTQTELSLHACAVSSRLSGARCSQLQEKIPLSSILGEFNVVILILPFGRPGRCLFTTHPTVDMVFRKTAPNVFEDMASHNVSPSTRPTNIVGSVLSLGLSMTPMHLTKFANCFYKGFQSEKVVFSSVSNNPNFKNVLMLRGGHPFQTLPQNRLVWWAITAFTKAFRVRK